MNLLSKPALLLRQSTSSAARLSFLDCTPLLMLSFLLFPLGLPVLGAPPRLICDSRVLERYILEAREAENATVRSPPQDLPQNSHLGLQGQPPPPPKIQEPGAWFRGGSKEPKSPVKVLGVVVPSA